MTDLSSVAARLRSASSRIQEVEKAYEHALSRQEIGTELQIAVDDVVYQQRSALDYLANRLAECATGAAAKQVAYPMERSAPEFEGKVARLLPGVSEARPDIIDVVRSQQRWQPGLLDALAYLKAARAVGVPTGLEVSRSGVGAHVWTFFTGAVPAATARRLALGLLREAMTLRGETDLCSYDRLFPSQDTLPGPDTIGNLIAAPLQGECRRRGATVFLDLSSLELQDDQWAYLSTRGRLTPQEVSPLAGRATAVTTGSQVDRLARSSASRIHLPVPEFNSATLGAGLALDRAALPAPLLATLKHAASLANPLFYERERRRLSTLGCRASCAATPRTWTRSPSPAGCSRPWTRLSRKPAAACRSPTPGPTRSRTSSPSAPTSVSNKAGPSTSWPPSSWGCWSHRPVPARR